jgi:nucleotide-binding universal stress UspA family protein
MQTLAFPEPLSAGKSILDRILVAVDFSECSQRALGLALELQRFHGSRVCLFHSGESDVSDDWLGGIGNPSVRGEPRWESKARLRRFVENVTPDARDRLEIRAAVGSPVRTIPEEVRAWRATLVIVAASVHRAFLASPAEQLVHRMGVPTLILPLEG